MNPVNAYLLPALAVLIILLPVLILAHLWDVGAWPPPIPEGGPSAASRLRRTWIKVAIFTLALIGLFVWSGDVVTAASGGGNAGAVLATGVTVASGEQIFWGAGKCYTCHSVGARGGKIRGPNLGASESPMTPTSSVGDSARAGGTGQPIAVRAEQIAAVRAAALGHPMTSTDYLVESIANPSAYLSKGYKDEMPKVYLPPINLSPDQITSVVLYLQSLGGTPDPTAIHLPPEIRQAAASAHSAPAAWKPYLPGDSARGQVIFFDLNGPAACAKCHRVGNQGGNAGPDLTATGGTSTPQLLVTSLLEPAGPVGQRDSTGRERAPAHPDFGKTLNLSDFHDLLAFLEKLQPYRAVDSTGDSTRGRTLFFDVAGPAACAKCHRLGNRGTEWGPDLTTVVGTRTRQFILESILDPGKTIASGYPTVQLQLRGGRTVEGLVIRQGADSVWIGTSGGTEVSVPTGAIVDRRQTTASTMPADFGKKLTAKDLADLIAFLETSH